MTTRQDIERLRDQMRHCFKHDGPYTLASGRTSAYYYDGRLATLHPPTAWMIGNVLADVILESGAEAVGGLELGAVPMADAIGLAAHLHGRLLPTFIIRKEAKAHGTGGRIVEAMTEDGEPLLKPGRRVAVVDDAITTGGSIAQAIDVVQEIGCEVTIIASLVERHESNGTALRDRGIPIVRPFYTDEQGGLHIDDEFVRLAERAAEARLSRR